jgi:hypothetical protein
VIRGNASAFAAALRDVRKTVEALGRLPHNLAVAVAPDITSLLRAQFRDGVDPYGRPWAPLKPATLRKHGPPPLTHHGELRDGTAAEPMAGVRIGLTLRVGARYGAFHQVGFRVGKTKVPPRRILPNRGIPAAWRTAIERRARELAARAVREGR